MNIAGEHENILSGVADAISLGDTCNDLRWSAMLLEA